MSAYSEHWRKVRMMTDRTHGGRAHQHQPFHTSASHCFPTMATSEVTPDQLNRHPHLWEMPEAEWESTLERWKHGGSLKSLKTLRLGSSLNHEEDAEDVPRVNKAELMHRVSSFLEISTNLQCLHLHSSVAVQVLDYLPGTIREVEIEEVPPPAEDGSAPTLVADVLVNRLLSLGQVERIVLKGSEDLDDFPQISSLAVLKCFESTTLKFLEMKGMEVTLNPSASPRRLGQALRVNKILELIRTRCGRVPETILLEISRALQEDNRTLQYVDIGSLEGVTDAVAQSFTAIMASGNTTFRSLECNLNGISNFNHTSLKHML